MHAQTEQTGPDRAASSLIVHSHARVGRRKVRPAAVLGTPPAETPHQPQLPAWMMQVERRLLPSRTMMHKHGCRESNSEKKVPGVGQAVGCTYGACQTPGSGPKKENWEEQFSSMSVKWDPQNKSFFYLLCSHSFNEFLVETEKKKSRNMT